MKLEAYLSNLVYQDTTHILNELKTPSIVKLTEYLYALVTIIDNTTYVVIRGTDRFNDWLVNLNVSLKKTKEGVFHRGFYDATEKLSPKLENLVSLGKVVITGHSQGGAVAALLPIFLKDADIKEVVTFGQPRFTTSSTIRKIKGNYPKYTRVIHNLDSVCDVPPMINGYDHFGDVVYIDNNDKVHLNMSSLERSWDRLKGIFQRRDFNELVDDHNMGVYYKCIKKFEEGR